MIKVKDVVGCVRECSYVKMQVIINFLDDSGSNYQVLYSVYGTDYSTKEFLSSRDYVIASFDDYDTALDYFVKLRFAVDKSEGCQFTPDSLPFP